MITPRDPFAERYVYRRELSAQELLPAIGAAVAVGALAFYLARIVLQRTPMRRPPSPALGSPAHFNEPRPALRSVSAVLRRERAT